MFNIGEQVEPGTQTHRVLDMWVWSEPDVRRMVEQAGFTHITMSYASSTVNRLDEIVSRRMERIFPFAADLRIVRARKA